MFLPPGVLQQPFLHMEYSTSRYPLRWFPLLIQVFGSNVTSPEKSPLNIPSKNGTSFIILYFLTLLYFLHSKYCYLTFTDDIWLFLCDVSHSRKEAPYGHRLFGSPLLSQGLGQYLAHGKCLLNTELVEGKEEARTKFTTSPPT